ncbi:MAG TPA: hypothetical protein VEW28_05380 [Candidatus Kapabacteria bacterium]|nr:hypothetical protein [Candidatus Kapabacteria bacterium]
MKQSHATEVYALWFEVPKSAAYSKLIPLHGTNISKLVSTFTVDPSGAIVGFDTTGLAARIGLDYALIIRAELSVEHSDSIGSAPTAIFLVNEISGTKSTGNSTITALHPLAFTPDIAPITSVATLASSASTPNHYTGEVYLMNATDASNTSPGIGNFISILAPWQYGLWTIDSSVSPPAETFLGYFSSPTGKDTKSTHDSYNYPGGRSPSDTTKPLFDLTTGKGYVLVNAEPPMENGKEPSVPFPAPILFGMIPAHRTSFTPFTIQNVTASLPTIDITIYR